ncbi:T9SS type B sorting domain-containing protein [Lutibacter citreus]|uniref:T9SS type B sorting domain-containing protein n=1 Tax=Lutibacter citreus TaxID=2138210 RepID=UPI000DBE2F69|nr:gliding motility-associated C-terminal domain-containing protein [Lutibacter citreus]
MKKITLFIFLAFCCKSVSAQIGQQEPSLRSGVTFEWSDYQSADYDLPVTIKAVKYINPLDGEVYNYNTFVVPAYYQLTKVGPYGDDYNHIYENGVKLLSGGPTLTSASATMDIYDNNSWDDRAIEAFRDQNLNHYFESNGNGRDFCKVFNSRYLDSTDPLAAQKQTIYYDPAIPSNSNGLLAVTERGGNNCYYIEVWGTTASNNAVHKLGDTFVRDGGQDWWNDWTLHDPEGDSDYFRSGRLQNNGQVIGIALFKLNSLAPTGSKITRVEFTAASADNGDGKFFILQTYAVDQKKVGCKGIPINGDLNIDNNVPEGSTYGNVSDSAVILNTDGTYTYTPDPNFVGDFEFEYDVCLPASNGSICETAKVTLSFLHPDTPVGIITNPTCTVSTGSISVSSPITGSTYTLTRPSPATTIRTGTIFNNLNSGNYTLTETNAAGCVSDAANLKIEGRIDVNAEAGPSKKITCRDDTVVLNGSSNNQNVTYLWTTSNGIIDSGATTLTPTVSQSGIYTLTVTGTESGCSDSDTVIVNKDITKPITVLTAETTELTCLVKSIVLDASASTGGDSFYWSTGETTSRITITDPGNYYVFVSKASNGCSKMKTIRITQDNKEPEVVIKGDSKLTCSTTSVVLDASSSIVQGTASYLWSTGAITSTINVEEPGDYSVTVTDSNNGCSKTKIITITEDIKEPEVVITGDSELTCSTTSVTLDAGSSTVQGISSYLWSTGATTSTINVTEPGNYSVTVTDSANGCDATSEVFTVTENIIEPEVVIIGDSELTCSTTSVTLDAGSSIVQETASYLWSTGATTSTINVEEPGDYSVTVTDSENGCDATSEVFIVTEDIKEPEIVITGDSELTCSTTSVTLDAGSSTVQGTASYLWSTGETTLTIDVTEPGDYSVTVTDLANGCDATSEVFAVTEDIKEPEVVITGDSELTCLITSVTLDASSSTVQGAASYLWSTGATTSTINVEEPGDYSVTVTDSENGCSSTSDIFKVSQDIEVVDAKITGDSELTCLVTNVTLDAGSSIVQGTASYLWSTGAITSTINVIEPGDYSVTVTDLDNGCDATSEVFAVTEDIIEPEVVITGDSELTCSTTSVTLDAGSSTVQGTAGYLWNTGAITATIDVTEPGDYSVTVTDLDNGCSNTSEIVEITQNLTGVNEKANICDELTDVKFGEILTVNLNDYLSSAEDNIGTWVSIGNEFSLNGNMFDVIKDNTGTSYIFEYTDDNGCISELTIQTCKVLPCSSPEDLDISKVLTPNGDGYNDYFEVLGADECGFTVNLQIINRWGKMIYQSDNYQNNWDGHTNTGGLTIGTSSNLPTGTYFYIVKVVGIEPITGYIYLGTH